MRTKLEEAIIKAVPSILDLKLGCMVREKGTELDYLISHNYNNKNIRIIGQYTKDHLNPSIVDGRVKIVGYNSFEEYYEIIGRDITLTDILIALGKKFGEYHVTFWGDNILELGDNNKWDLTKTLKDQLKETKDFLSDLLT